jgi:hypothetical protein
VIWPDLAAAYSMNSFIVFAGKSARVTSTTGTVVTRMIGAKSFTGS